MDDDHPLASLWAFHMNTGEGAWCAAYRFATAPLRACRLSLSQLHLEPGSRYIAFDFWAQTYLGEVADGLVVPALPLDATAR